MRRGCVEQSSIELGYAQLGALDTNLSTWKVPETEMLLLYTVFDAMCSTLIIVVQLATSCIDLIHSIIFCYFCILYDINYYCIYC